MNSRIFNIDNLDPGIDIVVSISGLTLINGLADDGGDGDNGGAILNNEKLSIDSCVFDSNSATFRGGAILNVSTIGEITNSTFSGNSSDNAGGAIANAGGLIEAISNNTFSGNSADFGGAIDNLAQIGEITNSTFSGNTASTSGGAIDNGGLIEEITNSTFTGNSAENGGAISNFVVAITGEITNSIFNDNSASLGGAISNEGIITEITNSTFSGNSANRGGAIDNFFGTINISFTTIANNEAVTGGGLSESGDSIHIRNSIVAHNTATFGDNCSGPIDNEGNNYSNDASCGFDFDNANILLGPLADNGGPTQTLALLGGDPLDGASPDCDPLGSGGNPTGVPLPNDQRFFPRPFGPECDSGAYESGPSAAVTIQKVTDPPGGKGFDFTTTGFDDLEGCGLQGDPVGELVMDHGDSQSCAVPFGDYTVTEDIPASQVLNIFCTDIPPGAVIDNDTGELGFSIISSQFNVNCLFINVTEQTLLNAMEEPPGANCEFGGIKIETGLDTNLNGVLDPDEVLSTFFVCNGEPGAIGPPGPQGPGGPAGPTGPEGPPGTSTLFIVTEEPPGQNCPEGGIKIETGTDTNTNGVLDPNEVLSTFFVCNGEQGPQGPTGPASGDGNSTSSSCSLLAGASTTTDGLAGLLLYALIPAAIVVRRRFRKKVVL